MTRQSADRFFIGDVECDVAPLNALPRSVVEAGRSPDEFDMGTACWRGYVANWSLRDRRLFLERLHSRSYTMGPERIAITTTTLVVPLINTPVEVTRLFCPPTCAACDHAPSLQVVPRWHRKPEVPRRMTALELDFSSGRLVRSRHALAAPHHCPDDNTPFYDLESERPWEWTNAWRAMGAVRRCGNALRDSPERDTFRTRRVGARFRQERMRRGWSFGDWARAAGLPPARAGKLAEFERGYRKLDHATVDAMARALEVTPEERSKLGAQEEQDFLEALEAWRQSPESESVTVRDDSFYVPEALREDPAAIVEWARELARIAWRQTVLVLGRREILVFDGQGELLRRSGLVVPGPAGDA